MGFRLANVAGRAALVEGDNYYDLESISGGSMGPDPMAALEDCEALSVLSASLADKEATGALGDVSLDAPVPRPRNCFGIGLNYKNHAEESGIAIPASPKV